LAKGKIPLKIVDVPGVDDFEFTTDIRNYVKKHFDSILPVMIVDSSAGAFTNLV
jgi:hypothetical protein